MFGVCLGLQAMGQAFGGQVVRAPNLMHGKVSTVHHTGQGVFKDVPQDFTATRYHSLIVDKATLPDCLEMTAETDGLVMGLRHKTLNVHGVQFHPGVDCLRTRPRHSQEFPRSGGSALMAELKPIIAKAAAGTALSRQEAREAFNIMMSGEATPSQIGGLLDGAAGARRNCR